jgi:hypothetical protein
VPVSVYIVVVPGEKATLFVMPPVQLYVAAPVPWTTTVCPEQITELLTETLRLGRESTFTDVESVDVPQELMPVSVYDVVVLGINGTPFVTPPDQLREFVPDPFKVTEFPKHTEGLLALTVNEGAKPTEIVCTALFRQPFTSVPVTV